jgi:hypothetical protein
MNENPVTMELVDAADVSAQARAQDERFKRNSDWLEAHWADLLPQARGKHLVVAGQEAFIADTPEEARAMAEAAHPDDDGAFGQYVFPNTWPRIYANRRRVATWR